MARFRLAISGGCAALACAASVQAEAPACLALSAPVAAGEHIALRQVRDVPCRTGAPRPPLVYDAGARAPVAIEAMAEGTYLGRVLLDDLPVAKAGEALHLRVRSGPVIVERDVHTLRAVRSGDEALLRTADGTVIAARFLAAKPRP